MNTNAITSGGTLNHRRISKPIMVLLFCAVCVAAYFIITHFFSAKSLADDFANGVTKSQTTGTPPVQTTSARSQGTSGEKVSPSLKGSFSNFTYQPGKQHSVRQLTGTVVDRQNKASAWWIHPKTDEEARWMDTYGYPTAKEEERLRSASLDELKALADAGDLNAKAHWVGRSFVSEFESGNFKTRNNFTGRVEYLLTDGGPYQATTFMQYYGELLSAYSLLPQEQRTGKWVQNVQDLAPMFKLAEIQLKMLGDDVGLTIRSDVFAQAGGYFQNYMQFPADGLASVLVVGATRRAEKGEPPLVIVPRPKQPPGDSTFYLERFSK